jgi:hypothetical protein
VCTLNEEKVMMALEMSSAANLVTLEPHDVTNLLTNKPFIPIFGGIFFKKKKKKCGVCVVY